MIDVELSRADEKVTECHRFGLGKEHGVCAASLCRTRGQDAMAR
jgi:hypothetical protein